ncbi:DUF550 domain-containing protein [Salmonella enterica]
MTTINKERIELFIKNPLENGLTRGEQMELARIALASMDAEPVAYSQVQRYMMKDIIVRKLGSNLLGHKLMMADIHAVTMALIQAGFRTAPPASERERIRREHAEWSDKTFGDVGPVGPLKHLSKEALEAAAEPGDLSEWADMQFLLWDAQRRAGISDGEITAAMEEKLKVNMARQWPEPKDGEPRLHIKEQPVPIVPETLPCSVELKPGLIIGKGCKTETLLTALKRRADYYAELEALTPEQRAEHDVGIAEFIKSFGNSEQLNSPAIPDDWVMVPKEPTQAMINAWLSEVADWRGHVAGYKAMLAAVPEKETRPCTK